MIIIELRAISDRSLTEEVIETELDLALASVVGHLLYVSCLFNLNHIREELLVHARCAILLRFVLGLAGKVDLG